MYVLKWIVEVGYTKQEVILTFQPFGKAATILN